MKNEQPKKGRDMGTSAAGVDSLSSARPQDHRPSQPTYSISTTTTGSQKWGPPGLSRPRIGSQKVPDKDNKLASSRY